MNQQAYCWYCGRSEDACGHVVQSASRAVSISLEGSNPLATASTTVELKVHAHICEECASACCAIISDAKRGEVATTNPAPEHKE